MNASAHWLDSPGYDGTYTAGHTFSSLNPNTTILATTNLARYHEYDDEAAAYAYIGEYVQGGSSKTASAPLLIGSNITEVHVHLKATNCRAYSVNVLQFF